ncbi:MAG: hypothetical protein ACJ8B6_00105 [Gemmatimonadales bacterium]
MATLQICYLKNGNVVCTSASVMSATSDSLQAAAVEGKSVADPDKKKVKDDVATLLSSVLAESPEFFVMSYNPK